MGRKRRRGCTLLAATSLLIGSAFAQDEIWHLVDIASVACPKPVNLVANAPTFEYYLTIDKTSDIDENAPYIVSFMRKTKKAIKIKYKVEDANGVEVMPVTEVNLAELDGAKPANCNCVTGLTIPEGVKTTYGANYGNQCAAWDKADCAGLWPPETLGPWCCKKWCYASAECPDAYASQVMPGQYFSYSACSHLPADTSVCTFKRKDPCECDATARSKFTTVMKNKFPDNYGLTCQPSGAGAKSWDYGTCGANYPINQLDLWCCQNWCYVSKSCPSAKKSLNEGVTDLYWSSNACADDAELLAQCPYKPQVAATDTASRDQCKCVDTKMGDDILKWSTGQADADYGTYCKAWDQDICHLAYPKSDPAMWCCESWCWVDSKCPSAQTSVVWPGHYYSYTNCTVDAEAVSSCRYSDDCKCTAADASLISKLPGNKDAAIYGATCGAHDSVGCAATWKTNEMSGWSETADVNHSWCCDSWCYVPEKCPIGKKSWISQAEEANAPAHRRRSVKMAYYSYQTCDDTGDKEYREATDTCVAPPAPPPGTTGPVHRRRTGRRLRGEANDENPDPSAPERQLAARRRSSGWSRSRTSYPRRRYSAPRRRAPSPRRRSPSYRPPRRRALRRRAPSAPSFPAPRRRGGSYFANPRRRALPRRRMIPRRRQPTVPRRRVPSPLTSRRRSTLVSPARRRGSAPSPPRRRHSSDRRRMPGYSTPAHRRRASYGYTSRPQMMNKYHGNMPYATSYGYTGVNAYPSGGTTNVAMYALAGAAGGAVLGAGAMYAYSSMYGSDWEVHRRRRSIANGRMQWCTVLSSGPYQGDMMDCYECAGLYGQAKCPSVDGCYSGTGCAYKTVSSYNRDDIEQDAAIPSYYKWPLKVTFLNISGPDINTDYVTGNLCPPSTKADFQFAKNNFEKKTVFKADLFLLLTNAAIPTESGGGSVGDGACSFGLHVLTYVCAAVAAFVSSWQ